MSNNVVELAAKPKRVVRKHRRMEYEVIFNMDDRMWHWHVVHQSVVNYTGRCKTMADAQDEAKRMIDKIVE